MPKKIAIVEDEQAIADNYRALLERQGFRVEHYGDRPAALAAFATELPDLAIIDVGLGSEIEGGFELCRDLRARSASVPIIFLSARDSELDMVSGLRLGADDYLTKDISLQHMLARILALFRRVDAVRRSAEPQSLLQCDALTLDLDRLSAAWQEQVLPLTLTEFWLVHALVRHPGHVKSRQQLMDAASVVLDDNTITSHIKRIRRKFQTLEPAFAHIETVYGMGYRWNSNR